MTEATYRGYEIYLGRNQFPTGAHIYEFSHKDHDGPGDSRNGTAKSVDDAKRQIMDILDEGATCFHVNHCEKCTYLGSMTFSAELMPDGYLGYGLEWDFYVCEPESPRNDDPKFRSIMARCGSNEEDYHSSMFCTYKPQDGGTSWWTPWDIGAQLFAQLLETRKETS